MNKKYIRFKIEDVIRILIEEMGMNNRKELEDYLLEDNIRLVEDIEDVINYKEYMLNKEI